MYSSVPNEEKEIHGTKGNQHYFRSQTTNGNTSFRNKSFCIDNNSKLMACSRVVHSVPHREHHSIRGVLLFHVVIWIR